MSLLFMEPFWKNILQRPRSRGVQGKKAAQRGEQPFRAELFSIEQLQVHAKVIAGWHKLSTTPKRDRLLSRLAENEEVLLRTYEQVHEETLSGVAVSPGGEWLIDNYYLIEEQIRMSRRHLPRTYSRQLPQLANGPLPDLPRVYHLALELITHLDGRIDAESATRFIASYQDVSPLRIGELWAVPIMLRLALIENLRRIAARISAGLKDRKLAAGWAQQLIKTAEEEPGDLILVLADMARSAPQLSNSFVAEFSRQLQGKASSLAISLSWIEQRLGEQGFSLEDRVQMEAQQQAANQISMGNSIASLRELSAIDWRDFVEGLSVVEHILRHDPAGIYARMDFATRDYYRHTVEDVAKQSRTAEEQVARHAIDLACQNAAVKGVEHRTAHVGYFLADKGMKLLEQKSGARVPVEEQTRRAIQRWPLSSYVALIFLVMLAATGGPLWFAWRNGLGGIGLAVIGVPLLVASSQLGVALANWFFALVIPPNKLPRMDYSEGIAPEWPTMVVVPTMLTEHAGVEELLENLEVHYLSNRDEQLYFALLTDFKDAEKAEMPEDAALLQTAVEGINHLNEQYGKEGHQPFFLFHRPRRWSKSERRWMGYERKRGKLTEFNAVLRGGNQDRFATIVGDKSVLLTIRFVITLDSDTELPRQAARQLVGTMAHPLVRPQYNKKTGLVCDGYAILQPRVAVNLASAGQSLFVKLFADEPGIDPYTQVVSDVYQDLFGEGSFIGKGIYDVEAFESAIGTRFPESRILSHDLLEGCYGRSGLVSDIQLYEDHPWHYVTEVKRRHRWIRGDWQIASWVLPWVPGADKRLIRNPISALSRWKIFDNLRRSLVAPSLLFLLVAAWSLLAYPALWMLYIVLI
ncbi:MAG TPA: glycosyltransferase family 2 protein, partial [Phycisphaerae bacterium]